MTNINDLSLLEELFDDDPFIRAYPSFSKYITEWDEKGGVDALLAPRDFIFELYASKTPVDSALHLWYTYNETTTI